MDWLSETTHEIILVKIAVIVTFFMIVFLIPAVLLLCNSIEKKKGIKNKNGIIGICFSILVFMCIIIVALATFTNIF